MVLKTKSEHKMRQKSMFALFVSLVLGIIYFLHLSELFENDKHFSHLSNTEREMAFRTEMAFYFNYYKRLADQNDLIHGMNGDNSLMSSINTIINDNLTEFPNTINAFNKFNIYPEFIIGLSFRLFKNLIEKSGFGPLKECYVVNRGEGLTPVESCEGLEDHFYFYIKSIFLLNGFVLSLVFLNAYLISDYSLLGAVFSIVQFAYNQSNCSRVQWSPPLRESFGYPIFLALQCYINYSMVSHSQPLNGLIVVSLVVVLLICWQFSQFILFTQLIAIFITFKCFQIRKAKNNLFSNLFKYNFYAVLLAIVLMFLNTFLFTSMYFSFLISNIICDYLLTKTKMNEKLGIKMNEKLSINSIKSRILRMGFNCLPVMCLTVILKVLISSLFNNRDDSHIWNLLLSKLTNYRDFHTLLYTCSAEFDFMPLEDIKSITLTLLMPVSIIVIIISIIKWPNKPVIQFNAIQTVLFMFMALSIMRLKLLFVPQLCIMSGLLCRSSRSKLRNTTLFALLISLSSLHGIPNLQQQYRIIGEYFNEPLEQLIEFTISSTHQSSVFAGTMPTMANLMLSTRRPIVNHPYYESALIRNRTHLIYQLYSSHELSGVYKDLSSLSIDYIVLEQNYCYSWSGKCRFSDIWKVEDIRLGRNDYREDMPLICDQLFTDPKPFFKRVFANNYYHVLQLIK